ncbi:uncharacterized protein N7446_005253 [Penicillium canescens]|uniref:Protein kinase domain-containing protein n=1 Tax=Penicillium canescens TaxID=5083 RepID=A0AAD6N799_PENCN|nr:uncharacterized protein N7446_005227 [Penicillium canescens]XP_058375330.1 uncharacterized protein N7446_005253 [Penicillium canescens]KAJ6038428.1 hypothetical protein N7460_008199 [Penicillium canescens]KAJ6038450.1 hypothetical protein N7460_008221 [Penicillium canescens]KAJ6068190.1 hypothetical protein N7446_005227 [Penicillium canescens]KAJ6068216.1 hypothetical protein N7446_005253 [Penicillium canescens]
MDPIQRQPSQDLWLDGTPDLATLQKTPRPSAPSSTPQPDPAITPSTLALPPPPLQKDQIEVRAIQPVFRDPWQTYEAIVVIFQGQSVFLARRRESKATLVNIHLLKQSSSVKPLLETISQISHPSFLGLVACYCWKEQVFLVREPVELSVSHILASRCTITEGEITAIVRPVLEGIQYLRGQGRALAALSADTLLLTEFGGVRIAGVEQSCQIDAAEMDAATMKLFALAEVVERLIMKNPSQYPWSTEVKSLPDELKRCNSPETLLRSKPFEQSGDEGELKMLVNAANKTAYHNLESFKRI